MTYNIYQSIIKDHALDKYNIIYTNIYQLHK